MQAFLLNFRFLCLLLTLFEINALALRSQDVLAPVALDAQIPLEESHVSPAKQLPQPAPDSPPESSESISRTLHDLLDALNVMQDAYFELWQGTWPSSIDWTAAVLGTHVSATLTSLTSTTDDVLSTAVSLEDLEDWTHATTSGRYELGTENLINHFFDQTSAFYFGENAISLRGQAFDDMLWVVLGWLENIKFQVLHSDMHYDDPFSANATAKLRWHGTQFRSPAAHRARVFYGLASGGWDESLCGGGMIWSPYLTPYKNAITNELYISASIGMYLYFPGDKIDSPFLAGTVDDENWSDGYPHNPAHLQAAIEGYAWLNSSNMTGSNGLYGDGFHISNWESDDRPGTRKCDVLNTMVYTYNQGVILSGLRGLWLATAKRQYLSDGHQLVLNVMKATGWPDKDSQQWNGLGRGGVLEEVCDSSGSCSQNSHTFKGIFFHHLAEFCRPMRPQEMRFLASANQTDEEGAGWQYVYEWHQARCRAYRPWIEHNANAALVTRNDEGKFGMWWGPQSRAPASTITDESPLPLGAIDYENYGARAEGSGALAGLLRSRDSQRLADERLGSESGTQVYGLGREPGWSRSSEEQASVVEQGDRDANDRGRGRTVETQSGGVAVLRALYQWKSSPSLA
ncbi:putative glycosyl hydrolase [Aspergillus saccharolyticus JOP 1030-1]|uniref:Six-hairpin glycosidase n=1 Tax=Aspergillus saccharolyticus JOP 1030-1 TaxID=1450539 RepID=A0A318Z0U5_9EURO|nr:Six-hairpin glycosidase [Aspergillus saccharolyticus JOP 1030-1]PYH40905.1 Six-hairpin glycosidase [Aspergillus saccharolyticus JOP 1030-1]